MHDHELKEKCREIARRDQKLRPLMWSGFLAIAIAKFVEASYLGASIKSTVHWIALLYALVVIVLWGRTMSAYSEREVQ